MIEDEAKAKWCPHMKGQYPNETKCITSDCMMWQSTDNECEPRQTIGNPTVVEPEQNCYSAGYCGLAGKR